MYRNSQAPSPIWWMDGRFWREEKSEWGHRVQVKVLLPWVKSTLVLLSLQAICQSVWVLLFDTSSSPFPHGLVTGRRPILLYSVFLASCPSFPIPKILFLWRKNTNSYNLSLPSPLLTQGGQYRYLKTGNSSHPGPSLTVGWIWGQGSKHECLSVT